jgi:hypothetical protein
LLISHRNTPSPGNTHASSSEATHSRQPLIRTASLPTVLWNQPWVAPVFPEDRTIPLADLKSTAFREASDGRNIEKFELRGPDVRELAKALSNVLGEAAEKGDFTSVLSPQRDFFM